MRWLVSTRFDLTMVLVPLTIAFGSWALVPPDFGRPLWAYVLFIVSFDVAHVWSTGYLTVFDPVAARRRRWLLATTAAVAWFGAFCVHLASPVIFWTALAYIAIGHFIRQQDGFLRLYAVRGGDRTPQTRRADSVALWTGALAPLALWHADTSDRFDWFGSGETFAVQVPEAAVVPLIVGAVVVATTWVAREVLRTLRGAAPSWGRWLWMGASWLTWWIGLRVVDHFFVAAAFINLFHGIPYTMLVWHRFRANPAHGEPGGSGAFVGFVARRGGWLVFYLVVLAIALAEEALWDRFVWGDYLPGLAGTQEPSAHAAWRAFWIAGLSLPQIVHYYLDGVLWRRAPGNEDLGAMMRYDGSASGGASDRSVG